MPTRDRLSQPPPRWARIACWLCFLCPLLSALWRVAMLLGADTGFRLAHIYRESADGTAYVLSLEAVQIGAAAVCLCLCGSWSERLPRWLPWIGGRAIPRWLPIVVGGAGDALLYAIIYGVTALFTLRWLGLAEGFTPTPGMSLIQVLVLALAYAPMLVWPPALTVALVGYWRRTEPGPSAVPTAV